MALPLPLILLLFVFSDCFFWIGSSFCLTCDIGVA
jgi:hypothetical protein